MNRSFGFAVLATATLAVSAAFAQSSTKAGTQIQNQASATYTDSSGRPQVATSNLAVTVVQQVYGIQVKPDNGNTPSASSNFALSPDPINDKQGVPSSSISYSYTVTNTGNDTDSYNLVAGEQAIGVSPAGDDFDFVAGSIKIYQDSNSNGQYDPGEPQIISALSIAGGGSSAVVVVATVPGPSATVANGKVARLDLTATSVGDITKKDNNNIAKLTVINDASLSLTKTATGPDASGNISYTLTGSNVGSQAAKSVVDVATVDPGGLTLDGILIADTLPAGTTLVAGSATGSAGGLGLSSVVYHVSGGNWTKTQPVISTIDQIGLLLEDPNSANNASENTLNVSAGYSLAFKVLIGASLAGGADVPNTATVKYDRQTSVPGLVNTSNTTHTAVPVTKGVAISTAAAVAPIATGSETQTATGTIAAGQTITFTNKLQNIGNVDDTFQVSVASFSCTPASGYNIQLFQSDGVSPLSSIISLTKGSVYNVFVKVTVPGNAAVGNTCTVNLSATSTTDTTKTDPTTDTLTVTQAASVLFGHSNGSTPVANATTVDTVGVTTTGAPNTAVSFPMDVVNKGGSSDSFNMTGSIVFNLVGGGTSTVGVKYYPATADTNGDNVLSATEISNAIAMSNTGTIASNTEVKVFAVVNVPATAIAASAIPVNQSVTSPTTGVTAPFNLEQVTVGTVYGLTFTPNGSGTTTSPGTLVYSHTLKNTGNSNVATTNLTWSSPSGFTYVLYQDNGTTPGVIDSSDTVITSGANFTLNAGATMPILVQVTTANGLTSGVSDARVITATAATATATVTDTTTIVAGELQLTKAASTALAQPRTYLVQSGVSTAASEITYTINAKNVGTANLTNVIVFDSIPNFTDFKFDTITVTLDGTTCAPATCPIEYSTDGGTTWLTYAIGVGGTKATLDVGTNGTNNYSDDATRITNIRISKVGSFTPSQTVVITFTVSVR